MYSRRWAWLALLALVVLFSVPPAVGQTIVSGTLSSESVVVVSDEWGRVVAMYPEELYVLYEASFSYIENGTGDVGFRVLKETHGWIPPNLPAAAYIPELGARVRLAYSLDVSLQAGSRTSPGANNTTIYIGGIAGFVEARIYMFFETPPTYTGVVDLGYLLKTRVFGGAEPRIYVELLVERIEGGAPTGTFTLRKEYLLSLDGLEAEFFSLRFYAERAELRRYVVEGDLLSGVDVVPRYDVRVCGNIQATVERTLAVVASIADRETVLYIDSDPDPECGSIPDAPLTPGMSVMVNVRSGFFTLFINETIPVEGYRVSIGRPVGSVTGSPGMWLVNLTVPVSSSGYYTVWPATRMEGSVYTDYGAIPCRPITIVGIDTYALTCSGTLYADVDVEALRRANFTVRLRYWDEVGGLHTITGTLSLAAFDPTNIADVSWQAMTVAQSMLFAGIVFVLTLLFISMVKEAFTGLPLIDIAYLRGVLLTLVVSVLVIVVVLPLVFVTMLSLLSSMPIIGNYVSSPASLNPKDVFFEMVGYYDKLFQKLEVDYTIHFVGGINQTVNVLKNNIYLILVFFAAALALMFYPGGSIPFASLFGSGLMLVVSFLGILLMLAPSGAFILAAIAVGRILVILAMVIVVVALIVGLIFIVVPSPTIQRIGEEMFGGALLFFIAFPLLGPVTYSLYNYVLDNSLLGIQESQVFNLGPVNVFLPIKPIATIMIFLVASGIAMILVVMSIAYILSRIGIAAGLGEAFSSLIWRG